MEKDEKEQGNLSLFPNGPVNAVIVVSDSAIVNQTDGHWTMTGSDSNIPTFDLDTYFMRSRDDL